MQLDREALVHERQRIAKPLLPVLGDFTVALETNNAALRKSVEAAFKVTASRMRLMPGCVGLWSWSIWLACDGARGMGCLCL